MDGQLYISLAFIEGRTLKELARSEMAMPQRQAAALVRHYILRFQVAGGLLWAVSLALPGEQRWWLWVAAFLWEGYSARSRAVRVLHGRFPVHLGHLRERFGTLIIIVLGETFIKTITSQPSIPMTVDGTLFAAPAVATLFALWWLYFAKPAHRFLTSGRVAFLWGYGHYLIFASVAAVGAGLAVNVDHITHHAEIGTATAGASVTIPVVVFLAVLWALHIHPYLVGRLHSLLYLVTVLLVLGSTFTPWPVLATGLVLTAFAVVGTAVVQIQGGHRLPDLRANSRTQS